MWPVYKIKCDNGNISVAELNINNVCEIWQININMKLDLNIFNITTPKRVIIALQTICEKELNL